VLAQPDNVDTWNRLFPGQHLENAVGRRAAVAALRREEFREYGHRLGWQWNLPVKTGE